MSQHLSGEQLSAWMTGDRPAEVAEHCAGCPACRDEVARFTGSLASFRDGLRLMAVPRPAFEFPERPRWMILKWRLSPRWALAGALLAVLAVIPLYRRGDPAPVEISDSALFDQVNVQLARRVPGAMEPLSALAWPEEQTAVREE